MPRRTKRRGKKRGPGARQARLVNGSAATAQEAARDTASSATRPKETTRFFAIGFALMVLLYSLFYFPHQADGWFMQRLQAYLAFCATLAGTLLAHWDASVSVSGTLISGRFPLEIVKSCSGLDLVAVYSAAVLAFPAPHGKRALGVLAGAAFLFSLNIGRIAALYVVGVRWPRLFDRIHEELFVFALGGATVLAFLGWAFWARSASPKAAPLESQA